MSRVTSRASRTIATEVGLVVSVHVSEWGRHARKGSGINFIPVADLSYT